MTEDIPPLSCSSTVKPQTQTQTQQQTTTTMRLTLLTVVELVELDGFRLPLTEDQVVGDVTVGVVGRFPLEDDLGGRVGRGNGVQRDRGF